MIANDGDLKGTRARIAYFEDLLAQMRVAASAEMFPSMASGYRAKSRKCRVKSSSTSRVMRANPCRPRSLDMGRVEGRLTHLAPPPSRP